MLMYIASSYSTIAHLAVDLVMPLSTTLLVCTEDWDADQQLAGHNLLVAQVVYVCHQ